MRDGDNWGGQNYKALGLPKEKEVGETFSEALDLPCAHVRRPEINMQCPPQLLATVFFETESLNLEATNSTRLADQRACHGADTLNFSCCSSDRATGVSHLVLMTREVTVTGSVLPEEAASRQSAEAPAGGPTPVQLLKSVSCPRARSHGIGSRVLVGWRMVAGAVTSCGRSRSFSERLHEELMCPSVES